MPDERIPDDEIIYRRIPPLHDFFEEPDRVTSANYKLDQRNAEFGLSVYRASVVTSEEVLQKPEAIAHSRIAAARVGEVRTLCGGDGQHLRLDVIVVDDENDPGHAEIRGPQPGQLARSATKALQRLFRLI